MPYTGRCACGNVKLTINGAALAVRQCWCRQCQQVSGGGATHNAMFKAADIAIQGELGSNAYKAASGNTLTHYFCAACGTPIYAQSSARMHMMTMRLGAIDMPHDLKPQVIIWTSEAPAWAVLDPTLEKFSGQAPAPQPTT